MTIKNLWKVCYRAFDLMSPPHYGWDMADYFIGHIEELGPEYQTDTLVQLPTEIAYLAKFGMARRIVEIIENLPPKELNKVVTLTKLMQDLAETGQKEAVDRLIRRARIRPMAIAVS